ncbi:hypothetical protein AAG570_012546 [Ranatra chinensis]|uniref:Trafficking protein particle complex subunit 13 n=1 Tax=Ranatra chinensis TaxID=642074 RepID=A0ABD0YE58_9HEMI
MRLTRPTLMGPVVVTHDIKDLPGDLFNDALKSEVTSVQGSETIASGQFLLLPQCFGNIYLGETFSSYICVHNDSNQIAKDVTVRAMLQTEKNSITLSTDPPNSTDIVPGATVDEVIHHEVKEFGAHILVCEVSYCSGTLSSNLLTFRKFFKFEVLKPLDVKTKLYTAESDDVYLEAQVQNITSGTLSLEKVSLEPSDFFTVTKLNASVQKDPCDANIMLSGGSKQFLYRLSPHNISADLKLLVDSKFIGKLDIIWRSNLGEKGRLQTSPLHSNSPNIGNIRLSVVQIPDIVFLNEIFNVTCRIVNTR